MITSSNDSKMIPNAFEGVLLKVGNLYGTKLQVGYLTKQKLRDHSNFHHLLAYGDSEDDPANIWRENDDSSMNRGIRVSELKSRGIDDRMVIFDIKNSYFEDTTVRFNYSFLDRATNPTPYLRLNKSFFIFGGG